MFIIFLSIVIFLQFFIMVKTNSKRNLAVPFTSFWIVSILMSKYLSSNLYPVNDMIYNYSYIFVCSVLFGFLLVATRKKNNNKPMNIFKENEQNKNNIYLTIFHLIILIILLFYLKKYNDVQSTLPIYKIRIIRYQVGPLFSTSMELLFYNYVISSVVELFGLISIVKIFSGVKINLNTFIPLISLIVYSFVGNGRFGLFNAILFILGTIYFKKNIFDGSKKQNLTDSLKKKTVFLVTFCGLLFGMIKISSNRFQSEIQSFSDLMVVLRDSVEQAVLYFTGPFRALGYFFEFRKDEVDLLHGKAFFSGIDEFIGLFIAKLNPDYVTANSVISNLTRDPISIGPETKFNAFYTAIFNSYLDLNSIGLVLFPVLLGIIAAVVWNFHLKFSNLYTFSLLIYFNLILISTEYRFELQQFKSYFVIFLLIYLAIREEKKYGV